MWGVEIREESEEDESKEAKKMTVFSLTIVLDEVCFFSKLFAAYQGWSIFLVESIVDY